MQPTTPPKLNPTVYFPPRGTATPSQKTVADRKV